MKNKRRVFRFGKNNVPLQNHMKKIILSIAGVCLLLIAATGIEQYYRMFVCNMTSNDGEPHLLYVRPHTSMDSLMAQVEEHYRIASPWNMRLHARLLHFSHPKAGCYQLLAQEGDVSFLRRLRNGEQTPVPVTFNHIRTRPQLAQRLSEQLLLDSIDIIQRLENDSFMAQYGLNKGTAVSLFIPDTYEMFWTISPDRLFERMHQEYRRFWTAERLGKAQSLGLTPAEVATVASIIEEESNKDFEYPIIAGLYLNRLRIGMPLQACPTVKFALQDFSLRRILNKHLQYDSPYNTYLYKGLPPGPIRIPRAKTMDAVLNRTQHNYLYMCANSAFNGTHRFSATYAEHARYAREYQAELNRRKIH